MRSLSTLVAVLVCVAVVCFSSPVSATVLFQDDFEGHAVGAALSSVTPPVGNDYGSGTQHFIADTTTSPPGSTPGGIGAKFVRFSSLDALMHPKADVVAATAGQVITTDLDVYIMGAQQSVKHGILAGSSANGWGSLAWEVGLSPDGSVSYYDNGADWIPVAGAGTIRTDQWIHMNVVGDFTARSFTATVDGYAFTRPFAPGTNNTYVAFNVGPNGSAPGFFYDNLSVTAPTIPEPSALLLMVTGLLGLLAYAWRKRR